MTEKEYIEGYNFLQTHYPTHELLPDLEKGFSRFNVIYLKAALLNLPAPNPRGESKTVDETLQRLYFQKSNLFVKRAVLSNSLHKFPLTSAFDAHRAGVVDDIKVVQKEIERAFRVIEYYEANDTLPPEKVADDEFPIPADIYERKLRLDSVQSSLWRWNKEMMECLSHGRDIEAAEIAQKIDKHTIYKQLLKNALAADGVVIRDRKR